MNWERVWTAKNLERLLVGDLFNTGNTGGLLLTLELGLLSIVLATIGGAIVGVMREARSPFVRFPAFAFVQLFRNVPLLVLVFWAYFLPPFLGANTSRFTSVLIALTVFTTAYIGEFVAGGIRSVPAGQVEAAKAIGLGRLRIQLWIVLPQAYFNMLPALAGRYVVTIKNTSQGFLIGLTELTEVGRQISFQLMTAPLEVYLTLLLIYFSVNRLLSGATRLLEDRRRFNRTFLRL